MNPSCLKRLNKDILIIQNSQPEYHIIDFIENENKTITLEIYTKNYNVLEFTIPEDYPFKPPILLTINGKNYRYHIKNMPKRVEKLYYHPDKMYVDDSEKITSKQQCLCCISLLCAWRWSPIVSIGKILQEINSHNELKRNILHKLIISDLFHSKDLPLDLMIPIFQYL